MDTTLIPAIKIELGKPYALAQIVVNNHLEQDHRGIKQRTRPMVDQKYRVGQRFCRVHDEVRNFLRARSQRNERSRSPNGGCSIRPAPVFS
jgi:transposase-like protein